MSVRRIDARIVCMLVAALACVGASELPARAQTRGNGTATRSGPSGPRFEVGGGGGALGPSALGDADADLRANGAQPSPYRLFSSETRLGPSALLEARVGYRITPRITAEARLTVGQPSLRSALSADVEGASFVVATVATTEYVLDGGVVMRLPEIAFGRWVPFISGGAGRTRSVYDRRVLIENGSDAYAGGGFIAALGSRRAGIAARTGLRVDVRLQVLNGGVAQDAGAVPRVVATGSVFVAF